MSSQECSTHFLMEFQGKAAMHHFMLRERLRPKNTILLAAGILITGIKQSPSLHLLENLM